MNEILKVKILKEKIRSNLSDPKLKVYFQMFLIILYLMDK
jgi:hypothetical protein